MKKVLFALGMILMTSPVYAGGLVSKHATSVQLTVDAARTTASRPKLVRHQGIQNNCFKTETVLASRGPKSF